jgi:hypothetical protein
MPKNIDGIKKLSEKELKKSRKIVLDYIGEEDKMNKKKESGPIKEKLRTIDGIKVKGNKKTKKNKTKTAEKVFKNKDFFDELKNSQNNDNKDKKDIKSKLPVTKRKPIKKRKTAKSKELKEKTIKFKKEEKISQNKKRNVNKKKKTKSKRKKISKRNKKNIKKIFLDNLKYFKNNLYDFLKELSFKNFSSSLISSSLFLASSLLLLYLIFSLLVLRFNLKFSFIEKASSYIPVPAIISKEGIIMYKEYDKNKDFLSYSEIIILNKLIEKYDLGIDLEGGYGLEHKEFIEEKIIDDQEINRVAFMRIKEVEKAIKDNINFDNIKSIGDEGGVLDNSSLESFREFIENLKSGEVSGVVRIPEGNYFFKKVGNTYHYVNINNISLEEYLRKQQEKIKLFFLVK